MKLTLLAALAASALGLAACNTTPVTTTAPGEPLDGTVSQVQSLTTTACNFLPTVSTVNDLFVQNTTLTSATDIAEAICAAVRPQPGGRVGSSLRDRANGVYGTVEGVEIQGEFVK